LIDTATGAHLWADRFDATLEDIFELQDEIARSVAGAIEPRLQLSEIERARCKPTESLDAYDLYLRAIAEFHRYTEEGFEQCYVLAKQALAIDPTYAPSAAIIGWCRVNQRSQGLVLSPEKVAEAVQLATRAIEVGKDDPDALWMGAMTIAYLGAEHLMAATALERSLALNPNSAHAWMANGFVSCFRNLPGPSLVAFQRAMRLSPLDPLSWAFTGGIAFAHVAAGRYEDAIEWADRCLREQPRYSPLFRAKAVSYAHLGRITEAKAAVARLLELQPGITLATFTMPKVAAELTAIYVEGLRKAGMPEE
jgi:tetratricopeptide (TPR) repeat protein